MNLRKAILVEPGAHHFTGHYREKLSLWINGFRDAGWIVSVMCSHIPPDGLLPGVSFESPPAALMRTGNIMPYRLRVFLEVFWTYLFAFRRAAGTGSVVVGLTTSTLLPVAAARSVSRSCAVPFGQIVMYGNLFDSAKAWRVKLARWSLVSLLRSGAAILPNSKKTRLCFAAQVETPVLRSRIITVYDPIYVSRTSVPTEPKSLDRPLLIPGLDDARRSPIAHLEKANLDPSPSRLHIHMPGGGKESESEVRSRPLRCAPQVSLSSNYLNQDELCGLFASASFCLLAYRPSLSQGSGFLVQSIVCGTPVLCSRFPHAEELFEEFGRLGEVFEFGDMNAFRSAWLRLQAWGSGEWAEFHDSRAKLTEQVNAGRIAGSVIQLLQTAPP